MYEDPYSQLTYSTLLSRLPFNDLQMIARKWGAPSAKNKAESLGFIHDTLKSLPRTQAVVERLDPVQRAALAYLRRTPNASTSARALEIALCAAGFPQAKLDNPAQLLHIEHLLSIGIILTNYRYGPRQLNPFETTAVYSDPQLIAAAGPMAYVRPDLAAADPPADLRSRRPSAITLDILSFLESLDSIGGLGLTKSRTIRAADLRKLSKQLNWNEADYRVDGLRVPEPIGLLIEALLAIEAVSVVGERVVVDKDNNFTNLPPEQQAQRLMAAMLNVSGWGENMLVEYWGDWQAQNHIAMRTALIVALQSLRDGPNDFVSVSDFGQLLFNRIGRTISLSGFQRPFYNHPPGQRGGGPLTTLEGHIQQLRASWRQREVPWIERALTSWRYLFGIVELGVSDNTVTCFRFTELGRRVLRWGDPAIPEPLEESTPVGPVWIVQPDYEILTYLDQVRPAQLALLERCAERIQIQSHVGRYRLTRDSVYQGLERGTALKELIEGLQDGAAIPLPQNVVVSLREWAALRERIALRRRASLIEYPDEASRNEALSGGITGRPVADRFVLLDIFTPFIRGMRLLDYTQPLPPSLRITELGQITVERTPDLYARPLLNRWAAPVNEATWQLTAESVAAVRAAVSGLLSQLEPRLVHDMPPLLPYVLRAWDGNRPPAALTRVVVIQFEDVALADAVRSSALFKQFVRGPLGPHTLLLEEAALPKLRELLGWTSFAVDDRA
jgi:hypothetical protein